MLSWIIPGTECSFSFYLSNIEVWHFITGICYLVLDVTYEEDANIHEVAELSFAFSHLLTNQHGEKSPKELTAVTDGATAEQPPKPKSRLFFWTGEKDKEAYFSMKEAIFTLLKYGSHCGKWQKSPALLGNRMKVYHRLMQTQDLREKDEAYKYSLVSGQRPPSTERHEEVAERDNPGEFRYFATDRVCWCGCANGILSLCYDLEETPSDYLRQTFARHVMEDYFIVFLLALHEHDILLHYSAQAVANWNHSSRLTRLRRELVKYNILFGYNTVSEEMNYQNFYEHVYEVMRLDKLELEVQEVVDKVDEYTENSKERRMNLVLAAIAFLSVSSTLNDGIELAKKINDGIPLDVTHITLLGINGIVIVLGIFFYFWKK